MTVPLPVSADTVRGLAAVPRKAPCLGARVAVAPSEPWAEVMDVAEAVGTPVTAMPRAAVMVSRMTAEESAILLPHLSSRPPFG